MSESNWSENEKQAAKEAFNRAYKREINSLVSEVQQKASEISEINEIWRLHDFLSAKRHDIDGKYDYQYPMLIFTFARLLQEGWVHLDDLQVLERDKLAKITALARM